MSVFCVCILCSWLHFVRNKLYIYMHGEYKQFILTASWLLSCELDHQVGSSCIPPLPSPSPAAVTAACCGSSAECCECGLSAAGSICAEDTAFPFYRPYDCCMHAHITCWYILITTTVTIVPTQRRKKTRKYSNIKRTINYKQTSEIHRYRSLALKQFTDRW